MVSIILPSLNVVNYISECLESALTQTLSEIELICVDGGSTDGTLELLRDYESRCAAGEWPGKSMQVFVCDRKSYGKQVNLGLTKASCKYVAILETDDFVVPTMYERLVQLSEELELDYIRGEYDYFTTQADGSRSFKHVHHYAPVRELLTDTRSARIMTYDQNLWKGIYRLDFLKEHQVRFNESEGASFQDIGFNMQVFSYAKRAYYIDESFYRYRRDRNDSSIHSLECFRFYAQELCFLKELDPEYGKLYWPGVFERFACALSGELSKAATQFDVLPDSEYIAPYLHVLTGAFTEAMDRGLWPDATTPKGQVDSILEIIKNPMEFAIKKQQIKRKKMTYFSPL